MASDIGQHRSVASDAVNIAMADSGELELNKDLTIDWFGNWVCLANLYVQRSIGPWGWDCCCDLGRWNGHGLCFGDSLVVNGLIRSPGNRWTQGIGERKGQSMHRHEGCRAISI
jgi:hypothetical protein